MRGKVVRVRRRHGAQVRLAVALMMIAAAVYVYSCVVQITAPEQPDGYDAPARPAVTRELRFGAMEAALVSLGESASADAARIEAARYTGRGAAGYVLLHEGRFFAIGAMQPDIASAEATARRLAEDEQIPASAVSVRSAPAAIRVTAHEALITALEAAESFSRTAPERLAAVAAGLDSGAETAESARQQLQLIHAEAGLRLAALRREVGRGGDEAASMFVALALTASDATKPDQNTAQSPLFFSAQIKYNSITIRLQHIALLNGLAA